MILKMVQTRNGATGSSWIQFIKEKSKEYHAQKQEQGEKQVHPSKKQKVVDDRSNNRGVKATGR